jgi:hypothetical protein
MYYQDVNKDQHPFIFQQTILSKYGDAKAEKTWTDYARYVYDHTFLMDSAKWEAFVAAPHMKTLNADPAVQHAFAFVRNYDQNYAPRVEAFNNSRKEYGKKYIRGLMKMHPEKNYYPDANSTMRVTYGQVLAYEPQDGVQYSYYTTLDGLMKKYKPGDEEFDLPASLISLYDKRDYGRYADADGALRTCFITNNDITGGNSGSPVINGRGELIGLAFDGNWEAMSGDIAYDRQYKRTICVDTRFLLFLIEKMGKAKNLIKEMNVID